MRRFLIQSAAATLAEGVVFTDGTCAVQDINLCVSQVTVYLSLDHVAAAFAQSSDGLATLVMLDPE